MVVTIAGHACDHVLKMVLTLSACRLKIFLMKYEYLWPLQLCEDQGIRARKHVLAILTTYMEITL